MQGQTGLHSTFETSLGFERLCLSNNNNMPILKQNKTITTITIIIILKASILIIKNKEKHKQKNYS